MISLSSEEAAAWRKQWIADIQRRARIEGPALMRSARAQRLQSFAGAPETVAAVATPITPIPEVAGLPETGGIPRLSRETAMISAIKLLAVDVRDTHELVSSAVQLFYQKHGYLPTTIGINPMRYLAIARPDFFEVDDTCAAIGCYTVSVVSADDLPSDTVRLLVRRLNATIREDYSL